MTALDDWFHLRAGQDENRNVARVFVAIDDQRRIVGFYSLSSFTLTIADLPLRICKTSATLRPHSGCSHWASRA